MALSTSTHCQQIRPWFRSIIGNSVNGPHVRQRVVVENSEENLYAFKKTKVKKRSFLNFNNRRFSFRKELLTKKIVGQMQKELGQQKRVDTATIFHVQLIGG